MRRFLPFLLKKLLELKSNIKQTNSDTVFAKPVPPSPVTTQQQRGVKRSHEATVNDQTSGSKQSGLPAGKNPFKNAKKINLLLFS